MKVHRWQAYRSTTRANQQYTNASRQAKACHIWNRQKTSADIAKWVVREGEMRAEDTELTTGMVMRSTVEVARAPGINRRRSAQKTATHISVDLVIVLFRVDVTCHMSHVTVTRHNVCSI